MKKNVIMLHCIAWPDMTAPDDTNILLDLVYDANIHLLYYKHYTAYVVYRNFLISSFFLLASNESWALVVRNWLVGQIMAVDRQAITWQGKVCSRFVKQTFIFLGWICIQLKKNVNKDARFLED